MQLPADLAAAEDISNVEYSFSQIVQGVDQAIGNLGINVTNSTVSVSDDLAPAFAVTGTAIRAVDAVGLVVGFTVECTPGLDLDGKCEGVELANFGVAIDSYTDAATHEALLHQDFRVLKRV